MDSFLRPGDRGYAFWLDRVSWSNRHPMTLPLLLADGQRTDLPIAPGHAFIREADGLLLRFTYVDSAGRDYQLALDFTGEDPDGTYRPLINPRSLLALLRRPTPVGVAVAVGAPALRYLVREFFDSDGLPPGTGYYVQPSGGMVISGAAVLQRAER
ncbi:hypothetical protein ACFPZ0_12850 [Streptomonospora nanhaiensis]|uniref:Uncharacterized protein n=1 Tax=Streptomonospora nanhaiensis TaxID=1323731 RepID=A0A853BMP3_9ACTN|nr:hypothetical protein [Streptomonospora nanhaiensis]MBV2366643.1 fringe family glycosyltransferase [Streptomonospora nanhaiensis]MBX9389201.1 fringe family glycosyltransferase [Streptomonospora nanhaiensis]NYI95856.1 hypothetical protein [Streptomonospora nanhaiensis]